MTDAIKPQPGALAREWARLRADFWDFGMLSWIPLLLCGLLWWIFSAGIARDLPIAVIDRDNSRLVAPAHALARRFARRAGGRQGGLQRRRAGNCCASAARMAIW